MTEVSDSVNTLVARMKSHPEEFYGEADKWRFIFKEKFREVLTEAEKGVIHDTLRAVRRQEFHDSVFNALINPTEADSYGITAAATLNATQTRLFEQQKQLLSKRTL